MNLLDTYMQSEAWEQFMGHEGKYLYGAYLIDSEGYPEDEYLQRIAMERCLGGRNSIRIDSKGRSMKLRQYVRVVEFLAKIGRTKATVEEAQVEGRFGTYWERTLYLDNEEIGNLKYLNIRRKYQVLKKLLGFKKSIYKDALVKAGLITEQDIRDALRAEAVEQKLIAQRKTA